MALVLYTPTVEDAKALVELVFAGYSTDPVSALYYPVPASERHKAQAKQMMIDSWDKNAELRRLCVKDESTGELVSLATYYLVPPREGDGWMERGSFEMPDEFNKEVFMHYGDFNRRKKIELFGKDKPYVCRSHFP